MELGDPQSFNRYSYVTNDPINMVDPTGLYEACVHEAMTKYLGGLADVKEASDIAFFAGGRGDNSADGKNYAATTPENITAYLYYGVGPMRMHFNTNAELRRNIGRYGATSSARTRGHIVHAIQDRLGAHAGYTLPIPGHSKSNFLDFLGLTKSVDRVLGDGKFIRAALATLHTMSRGRKRFLTSQQANELIDAILNACAGQGFSFRVNRLPLLTYSGGGSEYESGFYPYIFYYSNPTAWLWMIRIEVTTVTIVETTVEGAEEE